jgi:hypothetical protein
MHMYSCALSQAFVSVSELGLFVGFERVLEMGTYMILHYWRAFSAC